jgi:hypothetical protein
MHHAIYATLGDRLPVVECKVMESIVHASRAESQPEFPGQGPMTFLAMVSCPLSLRERDRVRGY